VVIKIQSNLLTSGILSGQKCEERKKYHSHHTYLRIIRDYYCTTSFELDVLQCSVSYHTTPTQKLFCLHVFRQAGPQRVDCLAPRWETALSVQKQGYSDALFWQILKYGTTFGESANSDISLLNFKQHPSAPMRLYKADYWGEKTKVLFISTVWLYFLYNIQKSFGYY